LLNQLTDHYTKYNGNSSGIYSAGLNDGWYLSNIEYLGQVTVSIFNRWGTLVYIDESYSNNTPFKGLDLNGNELNEGVYFYTIETSSGQNITGSLTVLRK